jgi:hypothetical protein
LLVAGGVVSGGIRRLHDFILSTSLFSHRLDRAVVVAVKMATRADLLRE